MYSVQLMSLVESVAGVCFHTPLLVWKNSVYFKILLICGMLHIFL